jgi:uncharacterized membrane protein YqhA
MKKYIMIQSVSYGIIWVQYINLIHMFIIGMVLIITIIMKSRKFILPMRIITRETPRNIFLINHISRCKVVRVSLLIRGCRFPSLVSSLLSIVVALRSRRKDLLLSSL